MTDVELAHDGGRVRLDRRFRYAEIKRHLLVQQPLGVHAHHAELLWGEPAARAAAPLFSVGRDSTKV